MVFPADVGHWTWPQWKTEGKTSVWSTMWTEVMERHREKQRESEGWRAFHVMLISVNPDSPFTGDLTSSDLDDPCCHGDWQNKCDTCLLFLRVCEWWKWMWPQDQHAAILAKNQYWFSVCCTGPVSCNISIHMCTHSTLILPVDVSCVCACEGEKHWTKAAHCVWTAPLKQSLFLIQRRKRASWLNTDWMSV